MVRPDALSLFAHFIFGLAINDVIILQKTFRTIPAILLHGLSFGSVLDNSPPQFSQYGIIMSSTLVADV